MKLSLSLLLFSSIPAIVSAQLTASAIAAYWNITKDPTFSVQGNTFSWTYDGIASNYPIEAFTGDPLLDTVKVAFYDDECYVKDNSVPNDDGYNETYFSARSIARLNPTATPPGHPVLEFTMHPGILKGDSDLFTADPGNNGSNQLKFCVRLGLWAEGSDAQEVNFLETIATISLSMDGSFTTEDINVGPKDRSGTQAQKTYKVEAALCNTAPGGDGEFKQGEIIQVCITPEGTATQDGVVLNALESFTWQRQGVTDQKACCKDDTPSIAFNALSSVDVQANEITVSSVLYATFFATTGTVTATGSVAMGYARRRLGGNDEKRKLEDAGVAPAGFDVEVELTAETDGPVALTQEAAGSNSFPGLAYAILGLVSASIVLLA